jgi:NADPH:quinone reductase
LVDKARLTAGERLFVNGGSGSVGTAVLQVAKALGAKVAVTAGSDDKKARLKQFGADLVIDYHQENVFEAVREFAPKGVDVFWEATREMDMEQAINVVAEHGRIVVMAGGERQCTLPVGPFYRRNCTLYGFTITGAPLVEVRHLAHQINGWLANEILQGTIQEVLPLSAAAEAHRLQEQDRLTGKIVLIPDS